MKLFQVSKEFNSGSEFEYTTKYFLWAHSIFSAQKLAEKYVRQDGFRWSSVDQAFTSKDNGNFDDCFVRVEVDQVVYLNVVNGPSIDMRDVIAKMYEETK
jgi:hypothetical protein